MTTGDGTATKMAVVSPKPYVGLAILDAELTIGLPSKVTAATGIGAMAHAIEAYTTRHKKNPLSDMLANRALTLLATNLVASCEDGKFWRYGRHCRWVRCWPAKRLPMRRLLRSMHYPSRSAEFSMARMGFRTHWCSRVCSALTRTNGLLAAMEQMAKRVGRKIPLREFGITESDLDRQADDAML